jgi:hypothetical protein
MKTYTASGTGECGAQSRTAVYRAVDWLENYISKNPYTDAAIEARSIVRDLEGLRLRAGVDELLALLGQIATSASTGDQQSKNPSQTTDGRHETKRRPI